MEFSIDTTKGLNQREKQVKGRRSFFEKLGFFLMAGFSTNVLGGDIKNDKSVDRVKMLSQDGELVEIRKSVYHRIKTKKPVPHEKILKWIKKAI